MIRVLLIEDNPTDALLVKDELLHVMTGQFAVTHVERLSEALEYVRQHDADVILLDLNLPDSNGFETFNRVHEAAASIPIALLSYRADEPLALQMIQAGAQDYLVKGRMAEGVLSRVIRYSIERKRAEESIKYAELRFQTIFEKAPVGIALINSLTEAFVHVNAKYAEISGYDLKEFKNINRMQIIYPDDVPAYQDKIALLNAQQIHDFRISSRLVRPDESVIWIDMSVASINYKDNLLYHLCMIEDTTAKKQAMEKLHALTKHLQNIREDERAKISREIHDVLGGIMSVIRMDLDWLCRKAKSEFESFYPRIHSMHQLTGEAIELIRKISKDLRPSVLDNLGLKEAIKGLVREFEQHHDIKCHLTINKAGFSSLGKRHETEIFRIIQEAFTNIAQHAQATVIEVNLTKIGKNMVIEIRDNGIGITEQQLLDQNSFGFLGMFERAEQLNGKLKISGNPSQGSIVQLSIPLTIVSRRKK
ncbi:MAG: response regulator [Nitrosomonas sp.]|nr:response regulator [Nitrosomonas sp.]MDP1951276.1 response regulator [Nitrosomonas sp.]